MYHLSLVIHIHHSCDSSQTIFLSSMSSCLSIRGVLHCFTSSCVDSNKTTTCRCFCLKHLILALWHLCEFTSFSCLPPHACWKTAMSDLEGLLETSEEVDWLTKTVVLKDRRGDVVGNWGPCLTQIIWVFPQIGVGPQNGWFIIIYPIKMDDLGVFPYFWKHLYLMVGLQWSRWEGPGNEEELKTDWKNNIQEIKVDSRYTCSMCLQPAVLLKAAPEDAWINSPYKSGQVHPPNCLMEMVCLGPPPV